MVSSRCKTCATVSLLIVACGLIVVGILGLTIGPNILQNQVISQLPLSPYSDQLDSWEVPPVPIYFQVWLWEVTNPAEVLRGLKPALVQRGPYTYLEHRSKTGVAFNENDTVTYRQPISYTFLREKSVGDENTVITMVNTPVVTMVALIRNQSKIIQEAFNIITMVFGDSLFVGHTVGEWIWGYEDPILKAAKNNPILSQYVPDDHFGYFYEQNATDDGLYTVYTGGSNIDLLNNINKWNGVSYLNFWGNDYANQINGTDGSWFPPLYKKNLESLRLYLYSTDVCRSLYAKFAKHSSVLNIPTEQFAIPSELFVNSSVNPDNAPFGLNVSGVFDVSKCRDGAPVFISFPHLLYADDRVKNGVEGIEPNEDAHRVLFEIEPHTGLVLSAQKRLQINVFVQPEQYISDFQRVSQVILPGIWINESTTIDEKSADDLSSQVLQYFTIIRGVSIALIPFGAVLIIIVIIIFARRRHSRYSSASRLLLAESHNTIQSPDDY